MKTLTAIFAVAGILLLCGVGIAAALCGFKRLDAWCVRALTDDQEENAEILKI